MSDACKSNLVQYYLVDATLKMRKGKIAAQCAHGALLYNILYEHSDFKTYTEWLEGDMTKIVLKATPADLDLAEKEFDGAVSVIDKGYTEVPENTRTVVVLPVLDKENAPMWIRSLSLL